MSAAEKRHAVQNLTMYLLQASSPQFRTVQIKKFLRDIAQAFGQGSCTAKLVQHTIILIERHERQNTLDRFTLVSLALNLAYDRFFDNTYVKRRIIDMLEEGRLSDQMPADYQTPRRG